MENSAVVASPFPLAGLLGVVFVTLKLLGKISWSWWWVTAPFWAPFAILVAGVIVYVAIMTKP